jgi:hypothetical protein
MSYLRELAIRIRDSVDSDLVPDDSDSLFLLYALLGRTKGTAVSTEDVHDAWVAWCELRGEDHPSAVPFDDLSAETRAEDIPFVQAIRSAVSARP